MAEPAAPAQPETQPADPTADLALYCPSCMYDLRGLSGEQCPECGAKLDREKLAKSSIPWVQREGLWIGALMKTAWLATFKTQLFCHEIARPVSLKDARQFRRLIAALIVVAIAGVLGVLLPGVEDVRDPMEELLQHQPMLLLLLCLMMAGLTWLFVLAFTGVHTYWFHPKEISVEQQNRAVALSYYACAPLLALVPASIAFGLAFIVGTMNDNYESVMMASLAVVIALFAFSLAALSLIAYLFVCANMARFAAHRSGVARLTIWLGLPPLWLGSIALIFVGLPVAGFYLYLVVTSL